MLFRISIKTFCLLTLVFFVFTANATNYYFSTSGNDANSGTDPSTPWQTLNKLNSFKNLKPGDNVLFKRGDTFYGSITVNNSGTVGNPITFGAYGTGENPVISGFTNVTKWTNLGGNIWESASAVSTLSTCNMVVINGVNTAMGRWPNKGYLTYQSFSGDKSITSSDLSGGTNWAGAELVIRKNHYIIDRNPIISQSGSIINYSSSSTYSNTVGYGFFIQNDKRTLDTTNEWYFNPLTKKLNIYSTGMPTNIQVATLDTLVFMTSKKNITFDAISFKGANKCAMYFWIASNVTIQNCNFNFSGLNAFEGYLCSNTSILKTVINNTNNNAIRFTSWGHEPLPTDNILISENTIKNTAVLVGMGRSSDEQIERTAILVQGSNSTIRKCVIDSTGYIPIWWRGNSFLVENNLITNFCFIKDDGGAIWTFNNDNNPPVYTNQRVLNNIILNGIGALDGSVPDRFTSASGIYCDGNTSNIEISGNTISNCNRHGILIHDAHEIAIKNNVLFDNGFQLTFYSDDDFTDNPNGVSYIRNMNVRKNVLIAKDSSQLTLAAVTFFNDVSNFGNIDSNYYSRPIDDNLTFEIINHKLSYSDTKYSLSRWQTYSGFDANSKKSPKTITDINDLRFEYNADSVSKTVALPYKYIDIAGTNYIGTITLAPYSSAVLIKNGEIINKLPWANAGEDQTVTLPKNSLTLVGSGSDADRTVVAYLWTKISGPVAFTIVNAASPVTDVSGLVQGTYFFELKVTDNSGAVAKDTMQVIVNPAANIPPVANAGGNQSIQLPLNRVTLSGSGTDADGTIVSYVWTKISGPVAFTIVNAASPVTDITGLVQGTYQFELKVINNNGAVGKDTMNVIVNAAMIPLTANAGHDQTITLPVNTVQLSGSGTGPIVAYQWRQLSGPSVVMSSIDLAATSVSGLIAGVYQFELKVLDNNNLSQRDTMSVTVIPAANIPPVANAGGNKTITLPVNKTTLVGSGIDADGMVVSYLWTKIAGSAFFNIVNAASPVTDITGLVQGTYQFELKVTDNNGAVGKDTMNVTVNAAIIPLTANAGPDQTITLPVNTVQLSGSGTGPIVAYQWRQLSGPSVVMSSIDLAATSVSGLIAGVYQFELKVLDNNNLSQRDTMSVTVNAVMIPLTANAGPNQTITLPVNTVQLSGSGTGPIAAYQWRQLCGPSVVMSSIDLAATSVSGLIAGVYQFELKVLDNNNLSQRDTMSVTVNPAVNIPPTANAGGNKNITLPVNKITLTGTGTDADGTITNYLWTKISGPTSYSIINAAYPITDITNLVQGIYQFELKVTDNNGAVAKDTMQVIVNAASNIPPIANAGGNQTIQLPLNKITLAGSGTDADGTVVSYLWTKISGPLSYSIASASSPVADVSGLVQGIYQFELKVTDNDGAIGKDTMQVIVNATANIPPVANAGGNKTIQLPVNKITLSGSGSDADGFVVSYLWTKISGLTSFSIINAASSVTDVSGLVQGIYQFELKVTDNNGAIGKDTMQITVNAAANIPPVANAGGNKSITLPVNKTTFAGSGSDADGSVVSYLWTKISGPNSYSIVNVASPVTDVSGLIQGVFQFELKVTDNNGAIGKDTMQITVNAAANIPPVANAGSDITITLPVNSVNLMGRGLDVDGTITGYEWNQVYGPAVALITSDKTASTDIKNLIGGNYAFELTVTDNSGAEGKDTVVVIVALGRISGQAGDSLKIYPNPVKDFATLEINTDKINSNALIIISNSIGKKVYAKSKRINQNNSTEIIEMSNFVKGVYTITVYFNKKEKQSIKVVRL